MKKIITTITIALLSSVTTMAQDQKVAVFDPAGSVESHVREIVREEISSIIVNTTGYTVLERSLINKVLEENRFQAGGLVDDAQISEMGRRMGANSVIVTNLTLMDDGNFHISCKMVDVLTARVDRQRTARTTSKSGDLIDVVERMAREMFGGTSSVSENTARPVSSVNRTESATGLSFVFLEDCGIEVLQRDTRLGLPWSSVHAKGMEILREEKAGARIRAFDAIPVDRALASFCPDGWRVPSVAEWERIRRNGDKVGSFSTDRLYYTTTMQGLHVKAFNFSNGNTRNVNGNRSYNLRCIRDR